MRRAWPWLGWSAAAALALAGAVWIVASDTTTRRSVIVLDPLDEAVTVRFGAQDVPVPAGGRTEARVLEGGLEVEVRGADGRVLDRHYLYVPSSGAGQAVYGVLGVAPLFREPIVYTESNAPPVPPDPGAFQVLVGERFQRVVADYVFVTPPEQVELPGGAQRAVKSHVDVARGGWRTGLSRASEAAGGLALAHALARRLRRALPPDDRAYALGVALRTATLLDGPAAAVDVAAEALAESPESELAHRFWAEAMRRAGRTGELREHYRRLAAEQPGALAAAMRVRTAAAGDAEAEARAALARYPDDRGVLRAAGLALLAARKPDEAAALLGRIPPGAAEDNGLAGWRVRALAQAGRPRDAAAAALAAARAKGADAAQVALWLRAARLPGAQPEKDADELLRTWSDGNEASAAWVRALVGELEPARASEVQAATGTQALLTLVAWASRDPGPALELCARSPDATLLRVPASAAVPLALEAYRTGERDVFRRLLFRLPVSPDAVAAWVDRGVQPEEAWRLDDEERAAFALVRARHLRAAGRPVPPELLQAARADPLQGLAALAAIRWPEAAPGSNAVRLVPRL